MIPKWDFYDVAKCKTLSTGITESRPTTHMWLPRSPCFSFTLPVEAWPGHVHPSPQNPSRTWAIVRSLKVRHTRVLLKFESPGWGMATYKSLLKHPCSKMVKHSGASRPFHVPARAQKATSETSTQGMSQNRGTSKMVGFVSFGCPFKAR